jgi:AcrR family transcriptional regulator
VPRLAKGRTTYLTRAEIAEAALALFDAGPDQMSFRNLAASLGVSTTAIYHHFPSRYDLIMAVVDRVWTEATTEVAAKVGDPAVYSGDAEDFVVISAVEVRRAFGRHWRVAPYIVAPTDSSPRLAGGLAVVATALERMGMTGERAGEAIYALSQYLFGAVLVYAARRIAADEIAPDGRPPPGGRFVSVDLRPAGSPASSAETGDAIDDVITTVVGADHIGVEEELFVTGLRDLLRGLRHHED